MENDTNKKKFSNDGTQDIKVTAHHTYEANVKKQGQISMSRLMGLNGIQVPVLIH